VAEFENKGTDDGTGAESSAEPGAATPAPFQISFGEIEYEAPEDRGAAVACTNCGYPNQAGRPTCWQCGTALDEAAPISGRKKIAPGSTGPAKRPRAKATPAAATAKKPAAKKAPAAVKPAAKAPAAAKAIAPRQPRAAAAPVVAPVAHPASRLTLILGSVGIIGGFGLAIALGHTASPVLVQSTNEAGVQNSTILHNQIALANQLAANNTMMTVGFGVSAVVALAFLFGRRRG